MNKKVSTGIILVFLTAFAVSATIFTGEAASNIMLTPSSGKPGDTVHVEGSDFAASKAVGIGLGEEVRITNESVNAVGNITILEGATAHHPIKPGSFRWTYTVGGTPMTMTDNGNGTLHSDTGFLTASVINYTSGFFSRTSASQGDFILADHEVTYTTYDAGVVSSGLGTDSSGMLSANFTVPDDIWNGTHTVTVIDEAGNKATSDFTVVGSDFIPEALTVSAVVLLTSAAAVVSFYWMRKPSYTKNIA
jgi:hypothetical protein